MQQGSSGDLVQAVGPFKKTKTSKRPSEKLWKTLRDPKTFSVLVVLLGFRGINTLEGSWIPRNSFWG